MTNIEHIKELACNDCPNWFCQQLAELLDSKDKKIKELNDELAIAKNCIQSLSW